MKNQLAFCPRVQDLATDGPSGSVRHPKTAQTSILLSLSVNVNI